MKLDNQSEQGFQSIEKEQLIEELTERAKVLRQLAKDEKYEDWRAYYSGKAEGFEVVLEML